MKGGLGVKLEPPSNGEYYVALDRNQTNVPRERGMSGNVQRCDLQVQYDSAAWVASIVPGTAMKSGMEVFS